MPVPANIAALSTTAGSNSPPGSEAVTTVDDYLRAHAAFIAQLRDSLGVITGMVAPFASATAPTGWLAANGAAVSRATYASLFAAIGTVYGVGDGSTTFNLPDLRGEFVRGLDSGRGIDAARALGSAQSGQNASHTHTATTDTVADHVHTEIRVNSVGTANFTPSGSALPYVQSVNFGSGDTGAAGSHNHTLTTESSGGTEARPRNIALLMCIKF